MKTSPTARSLALMRKRGYPLVQVVEQWIPKANVRRDLYGFIDVLCVGVDIVGVQATSYDNISSRVTKIRTARIDDCDVLPILHKAGVRVLVHGWRKKRGLWIVREVDLSM